MICLSFSVIAGTVLLSNDGKHLYALLSRLGYERPTAPPEAHASAGEQRNPQPGLLKLSPQIIKPVAERDPAGFLRSWMLPGPQLCEALQKAGIAVTPWSRSEIADGTGECSFEKSWSDGATSRSVFYLIRGRAEGTLSSIRVKFVNPPTGADGQMAPDLIRDLDALLTTLGWQDLDSALPAIANLQDVSAEAFGASLRFAQERSGKAAFNLTVTLSPSHPSELRTQQFFSRNRWLPLPDTNKEVLN